MCVRAYVCPPLQADINLIAQRRPKANHHSFADVWQASEDIYFSIGITYHAAPEFQEDRRRSVVRSGSRKRIQEKIQYVPWDKVLALVWCVCPLLL